MIVTILCTGPSMSQEVADSVRNLRVVVINGAFRLAPWAEAMAAQDAVWWKANPDAHNFAGKKFSTNNIGGSVTRIPPGSVHTSSCSGVLGMEVAKRLGAKRILLLGADNHGSHYFGDYTGGLKNTTDKRHKDHAFQFQLWGRQNKAIEVINCTHGSSLTCFPIMTLEQACAN